MTTESPAEEANDGAVFFPVTADGEHPAVKVAGALVSVYVDPKTNVLRVSVDLDEAEEWLLRDDKDRDVRMWSTVPMCVTVQGETVFEG